MAENYNPQVLAPKGPLETGCQFSDSLKIIVFFTALNSHHGSCLRWASLSLYSLQAMKLTETMASCNKIFLKNQQSNSGYHGLKTGAKTSIGYWPKKTSMWKISISFSASPVVKILYKLKFQGTLIHLSNWGIFFC